MIGLQNTTSHLPQQAITSGKLAKRWRERERNKGYKNERMKEQKNVVLVLLYKNTREREDQ